MFKKILTMSAAILVIGFSTSLSAQEAAAKPPTIRVIVGDVNKVGDRPTPAPLVEIIPADAGDDESAALTPPAEQPPEEPPVEPTDEPPAESDDPPTFFGEPVSGRFVFILDRSGSMGGSDSGSGPIEDAGGNIISNPSRILVVKAEAVKVLTQLSEEDEFAIVKFESTVTGYQSRVFATQANIQAAVSEINDMQPGNMTAAHDALEMGILTYGSDLDKIYFLCDGQPNVTGSAAEILADFPGWWAYQESCTLVCVHIGTSGAAGTFMQALANMAGGIYIHK